MATPEGDALVRDAVRSLLVALDAAPGHSALNRLGFAGGTFTVAIETRRLASAREGQRHRGTTRLLKVVRR